MSNIYKGHVQVFISKAETTLNAFKELNIVNFWKNHEHLLKTIIDNMQQSQEILRKQNNTEFMKFKENFLEEKEWIDEVRGNLFHFTVKKSKVIYPIQCYPANDGMNFFSIVGEDLPNYSIPDLRVSSNGKRINIIDSICLVKAKIPERFQAKKWMGIYGNIINFYKQELL